MTPPAIAYADVARVRDDAELAALLAPPLRAWEAIVVGPDLERPLDAVKQARATHPGASILLLARPEDAPRLQHELLLTPLRGEPVRCVPADEGAPAAVERHLRQARLRRRHTQVLHVANEAMAPRAAPPPHLPPLVEQLLESAPVPLLLVDRAGRLLHRNGAARALSGARAATLAEALPGADAEALAGLLREPASVRTRLRTRVGGRHVDVLASPLFLPPALEGRLLILDDVTDLVRSEEARRREADLHAMFLEAQSDLGEGILLLEKGRHTYVNDALLRMLGYGREELLALPPFTIVAPEERERVRAIHERRWAGDATVPDVYETVVVTRDGIRVRVEASARILPERQASVVIVRDVSRRLEMQRELEESRRSLAQMDKLASMGSLVGGLAHEIRTPLTAILNEANLLERVAARAVAEADPRLLADVPAHVAAIGAGIDRIQALVRDLRGFMRGEAPRKQRTLLDPCVESAVALFAATQRGRVAVRTALASRTEVLVDPAQVQQILINLLQNAAEASPSGATVTVSTWDEPGHVAFRVADEGRGVPPEVLPRIFEAFVTTKPGGTGLGLAIVRRLAEVHRARVEVESDLGRGARFTVRLPAAPAQGPDAAPDGPEGAG